MHEIRRAGFPHPFFWFSEVQERDPEALVG